MIGLTEDRAPVRSRPAQGVRDRREDDAAITPEDALVALGRLTYLYTTDRHGERHASLPRPDGHQSKILDALGLSFPVKPKNKPKTKPKATKLQM